MKKLFNTGSELSNLVLHDHVLEELWQKNSANGEADTSLPSSSSPPMLRIRTINNPKWSGVSFFFTSPDFAGEKLGGGSGLVKSTDEGKSFERFEFLRGKSEFGINEAAIDLFHQHRDELSELRNKIIEIKINEKGKAKPLIITGNSLGGAVASLFTLWLLDSGTFSGRKPLICITFGSPLIGDAELQKALYKYTPWSTKFLHVASTRDPVLRSFAAGGLERYMPFGTFLLCSESGCSCFEVPETVKKVLNQLVPESQEHQSSTGAFDYGRVLRDLRRQSVYKKTRIDNDSYETPYQAGIAMQLSAIALVPTKEMVKEIEISEMKFQMSKRTVRPDKKLNDAKVNMAKLERYMKVSRDERKPYYDRYKDMRSFGDIKIRECVKRLINYWTDLIEEADMKPQAEGETLRSRWLFSGLNYLRIVEPLYIAEYYHHHQHDDNHSPRSGYERKGRLKHFEKLAKLVAEAKQKEKSENGRNQYNVPIEEKKKRVEASLTEDSLFWAKVEEAFLSCRSMKREGASEDEKSACKAKLKSFENYVYESVRNYDVSTEIFFQGSRFMAWWSEYNDAMGVNYTSKLKQIMVREDYKQYCTGELDLDCWRRNTLRVSFGLND